MPKSRRVVRKSRKTRGRKGSRRLRGGFFGKLFEGFQVAQTALAEDAVVTTAAQSNMTGKSGTDVSAMDPNATTTSAAQSNMMGREGTQSTVTAMQDTNDTSALKYVAAPPPPMAAEGPVGKRYDFPGVVAAPPPPADITEARGPLPALMGPVTSTGARTAMQGPESNSNITEARAPMPALVGPVTSTGARSAAIAPPPPAIVTATSSRVTAPPPPPRGPMKTMRGGRKSRKASRKAARKGRKASRRH